MLTALIMAGGRGTRFWPASTKDKPKQFLSLTAENTMIQETVRRLIIHPGKTIYEHKHQKRNESWSVIKGYAKITISGETKVITTNDSITTIGMSHQISNVGDIQLISLETATGEILHDMVSVESKDLNKTELGMVSETIIKMRPDLKDYLWGDDQLKEKYGIQTDMDIVAEAWELSAHSDGESIVASRRHNGLSFYKYLEKVGKEVLGWKCAPLQNFPLLVKFIDARGNLSIQVHPDDDYALERENQYGSSMSLILNRVQDFILDLIELYPKMRSGVE